MWKCVDRNLREHLKELIEKDADYFEIIDAICENSNVAIMAELYDSNTHK